MRNWTAPLLGALLLSSTTAVLAISENSIPPKKQTELKLYLTAKEANQLITNDDNSVLFIDIRTRAEINFLGMPSNADANIPYFTTDSFSNWDDKKSHFSLAPNSNFLPAVEERLQQKGLNKDSKVVLICRSGSRSAKAANLMKQAGYTNVYTIVDGYEGDKAKDGEMKGQRVLNGWKNSQLPWSYKLDKNKMYMDF